MFPIVCIRTQRPHHESSTLEKLHFPHLHSNREQQWEWAVHLVLVKTVHQYSFTQHIFMSSNSVNKAGCKIVHILWLQACKKARYPCWNSKRLYPGYNREVGSQVTAHFFSTHFCNAAILLWQFFKLRNKAVRWIRQSCSLSFWLAG